MKQRCVLRSKILKKIFFVIAAIVLTLPSLVITLYSYPCQDDFHYAYYAKDVMGQGHGLLSMSLIKTIDYYKSFCGCYTSTFLGYFFSGIINCNIWGIRIFELISATIFYFALYMFIRTFAYKVMGFAKSKVLPLYCLLLGCFNGLVHYFDNDDFYWFITSVQYLLISSIILFGVSIFICAFYVEGQRKKIFLIVASVFGFLGSGGTLSIAAFCCALYFLAAMWGFFIQKRFREAGIGMGFTLLGALINGIAPGNYIRDGQPVTIGRVYYAGKQSLRYTLERWETFVKNPIFWIILILFILILFTCQSKVTQYRFKWPVIFIVFLFCVIAGIIFPTILGYGYECYLILNRGLFISDMAFYLFIFLSLFYIKGWLDVKYPTISVISVNHDIVIAAGLLICSLFILNRYDLTSKVPVVRQYIELASGECSKYSQFCVGIYEEISENTQDIAEIHRQEVEDITCMMNPQFYIGRYDFEEEYANRTIARFYGKNAVYLYFDENADSTEKNDRQ